MSLCMSKPVTSATHIDDNTGAIIIFDICLDLNYIPYYMEIDTKRGNTAEQAIP